MYNKDGVISQDYYEHGMKLYTYKHVCVCALYILSSSSTWAVFSKYELSAGSNVLLDIFTTNL